MAVGSVTLVKQNAVQNAQDAVVNARQVEIVQVEVDNYLDYYKFIVFSSCENHLIQVNFFAFCTKNQTCNAVANILTD